MTTLPTLAVDALELIDNAVGPLGLTEPCTEAAGYAIATPGPGPNAELLLERLDDLRRYAGPALTAPLTGPASDVASELRGLELERRRVDELDRLLSRRNGTIDELLDVIAHTRRTIIELGLNYTARDELAIRNEFLATELEAVITAEGSSSGRRLNPAMVASRLREARKRAARKADELLADEAAANVVDAVIVED